MSSEFILFGDPHGDFRAVSQAAAALHDGARPVCIFLGDFDLDVPLETAVAPLVSKGCEILFIHGNHEADRVGWHDNLFSSRLSGGNLHARVVEAGGLRIAGLGGVFKERVWHPQGGDGSPRFRSPEDYLAAHPEQTWRGGLPLALRATIFPSDYEALADLRADVLVTHEAPSPHRYGFEEIDLLAAAMGARLVVHGHHHKAAEYETTSGVPVVAMGKADWSEVDLSSILPVPVP